MQWTDRMRVLTLATCFFLTACAGVPGDREAQRRLYGAMVSSLESAP
jgi:hypothetical protein